MFTGIVQGKARICEINEAQNFRTQRVEMPAEMLQDLQIGASVSNNGVCLTVTKIDGNLVDFDLMQETLNITNLGELKVGDLVNVERAMQMGTEIGGHILSGHVYCTAQISERIQSENNLQIWFKFPNREVMKYVLVKGFIAVDGISLTIGAVREQEFCVNLIPETIQRTIMGEKQVGDTVNIEIDPQTQAIVDTVERYLQAKNL